MRIGRGDWTVEASGDWLVTDHPECLTLELENGGALQLSSATSSAGVIGESELLRVAGRCDEGWGNAERAICGEFAGYLYAYLDGDAVHWRRWFLACGPTLLFATYNAEKSISADDASLVDSTLSTLRIVASKPESLFSRTAAALRALEGGHGAQ